MEESCGQIDGFGVEESCDTVKIAIGGRKVVAPLWSRVPDKHLEIHSGEMTP